LFSFSFFFLCLFLGTAALTTSLNLELDIEVVDRKGQKTQPRVPKEYKKYGIIPKLFGVLNELSSRIDAHFLILDFFEEFPYFFF